MSVPVYQIMGKGCHIRGQNLSFSLSLGQIFCYSPAPLANRHVDNFVHKLFTSLLIYYHAFYSMMFVFVFHAVKNKSIPNN